MPARNLHIQSIYMPRLHRRAICANCDQRCLPRMPGRVENQCAQQGNHMRCLHFRHCFKSPLGQLHRLRARLRFPAWRRQLHGMCQGLACPDSQSTRMRSVQRRKSSGSNCRGGLHRLRTGNIAGLDGPKRVPRLPAGQVQQRARGHYLLHLQRRHAFVAGGGQRGLLPVQTGQVPGIRGASIVPGLRGGHVQCPRRPAIVRFLWRWKVSAA